MNRFDQWIVRYARWLMRNRWWALLLALLSVIAVGAGARLLSFSTDYRVYFGPHNPQLLAFDEIQNVYSKNDNILLMFEPREGDVFQPRVLEAVREMTAEAWKLPYALRVDSITNYQHTEAAGDDLQVAALLADDDALTPERIAKIRDVTLHEPMLLRRLIAPDGAVTAINITFQFPPFAEQTQKELPAAVAATRALRDRILAEHPEIARIPITGSNMMSNAFTEAAAADMKTLVPAMYAMIVLITWLMLRSGLATLATTVVIVVSAVTAMGMAGYLGIHLTPPSAASPQIITTLAVADSIHLCLTAFALMRAGTPKIDALVESLRVNFAPVFLTSATTAIGFLSVNFTDSPPLKDLANITSMGVMLAWFYSIFLLPALLAVLPLRIPVAKDGESSGLTRIMDRIGGFVVRRRRPVFWSTLAVSVALTVVSFRNEGNDLFAHFFGPSITFRADTDRIVEKLTGLYSMEFSLRCGEPDCVSHPDYLRTLDDFTQWWKQNPKVLYVGTVSDIFKKLNKSMNGDDPAHYALPDDRELSAQYLLLYEMSLPFGLDLNNTINIDKSSSRFIVVFEHLKSKETRAIEEQARQWLHEHAPQMETHGVSPAVMFAHISKRNLQSNFISLPISLAAISLLLLPALRSVRIGAASLLPNLLPLGGAFGIWALVSGEINFTMAIVLNMTAGIIVDDTIHFLSKYLRARRELGYTPEAAVRHSFHTVGSALVVTTLILGAGFLILSQSAFLPNSGMARLTSIGIVFALALDLLLLPTLLLAIDRPRKIPSTVPSVEENPHEALATK
ncbi:MMPL family transporter [Fontimonas sp. SYSU GA230001]|uniref:efflux RND transporter permease subunit n=1 Tax=Fontimonas sp. SYSU GA230001 TaxID=3142450 RepID=UPI0032B5FE60